LALNNIALVYNSKGDHSQALDFAERATIIARQTGSREVLWEARTTAGLAYAALNQPARAREAYEEAIITIEDLRAQVTGGEQHQQRFFEDKLAPYHSMVGLMIAENDPAQALAYAERAKARVLKDVLSSGRVNITSEMTHRELERERALRAELVSLNTQISRESSVTGREESRLATLRERLQKARLDWEAFQANLYAAHPRLRTKRGQSLPLKLEDASDLLPGAKGAVLEYVVTGEETYLFVLTQNDTTAQVDLKTYRIAIRKSDLAARAEAFRRALARRDPDFLDAALGLYDLLIGPARAQLQGKAALVVVPDSVLWNLPFQALRTPSNRYLIEEWPISYAPSLTVLREMARLQRNDKNRPLSLLALGNPAISQAPVERSGNRRGSLPEAEREVKTIGRLYGPARSKVFTGSEAREDRIKAEAGRFGVMHLATHGILNDASPMYSHLLLARAGENADEDGLLEAWEIMKMDLKIDLAVLSACETARGRVGEGEGVIGFTWALFVAGSPTTVVSQWKVDSASTTQLMLEFHRRLKASDGFLKAHSLQQAAVKLMRDSRYRHPFYWAGFVVVGDGF
jgi:CHAT domain-containing protein